MPLHHDNGPGGGKQYLALPLPGPALVLDVRHSTPDDLRLMQYLATELEDLTREMRLNQVYQWRHLAECIDFLKLDLMGPESVLDRTSGQVIRNRTLDPDAGFAVRSLDGETQLMLNKDHLTAYIGVNYLNRVRNCRIKAINDYGIQADETDFGFASPEQSTVRVFFLIDLKEEEVFNWAADYATWLKEWSYDASGPTRVGRAELIETVAICMNAAPHRHYALLEQAQTRAALDTVILIQAYRDDSGYIDDEAQLYQSELMLYTLLLHWPESLEKSFEDKVIDPLTNEKTLTRPTYILGISALEYSARWGARWLDYGLAAKIIEILRDSQQVQQEEAHLRFEVDNWLKGWLQRLHEVIYGPVTRAFLHLQAIEQLQRLVLARDFQHSSPDSLVAWLKAFREQVSQSYTGTSNLTLQFAMDNAALIPVQLKQDYLQVAANEAEDTSPVGIAYRQISDLQTEAQLFLLPIFQNAHGAFPRALRQFSALTRSMSTIQQTKQDVPNLQEYRKEFEQHADEAVKDLERLLQARRRAFRGGKKELQRAAEKIQRELGAIIQKHLARVQEVVVANIALYLLQSAGLYNPAGQSSPYQQRLQRLEKGLDDAQQVALRKQQVAKERLNFTLQETQAGASPKQNWRNLKNRSELLKWDVITEAFLQSSNELSNSEPVNLLAEILLRRLGIQKSKLNGHNHQKQNGQYKTHYVSLDKDEEHFQAMSTALVAALLSANIAGTDLTDILPLLDQYTQMKQHMLAEPPLLDSDVLNVRQVIKEAILEKTIPGNKSNGFTSSARSRELRAEFVLAAWVGSQHATNPQLADALNSRKLVAYMGDSKNNPAQILKELGKQNTLAGYPDQRAGDDHFYLLLPPGETSEAFLKALDSQQAAQIHPVLFPDTEKLIYLHVHRMRQI